MSLDFDLIEHLWEELRAGGRDIAASLRICKN